MRTASLLLASTGLLLLAACDGPNGPNGPLVLGIVSGNHQTATAGDQQLGEPVVGKMVRTETGSIAFRLVTPAYAQDGTTVSGSPVAGAVVCAVSVTDGGLEPFTPCTNTASDGTAVFFFSPGTKAGEAKSEIRGTVNAQPAVFDTVVAAVEPGPMYQNLFEGGPSMSARPSPAAIPLSMGPVDKYGNHIEFELVPLAFAHAQGTSGEAARTLVADSAGCAPLNAVVGDSVIYRGIVIVDVAPGGSSVSIDFPQPGRGADTHWYGYACYNSM